MKKILFRAALLVASFLVTFGLIEAAIRYIDKGGLPSLPIFAQLDSGLIVLKDDVAVWHSRQDGSVYSLKTPRLGLRRSARNDIRSAAEWLAVGDSQVLGLGVVDTATFSAIVTARGFRMANAGVPG